MRTTLWGVYLPGGVPAWGSTCLGVVVYLPGMGVPARGVPAWGGVYLHGGCTCPEGTYLGGILAQVIPPVNRMTDRQV